MIIDFELNTQEFYLNIQHDNGLIFIIDNQFDGKQFEVVLDEYLTVTNERYSHYSIPSSVFDLIDNGSYHYRVLTPDRKRIISGHLTAKDDNYSAVNYESQIQNTNEVDNKKTVDFSEQMNDWFD